ncbi:MAG: response regulator [Syntrophobacteraceae bacterium]|nr:response regulator [Desulfobacteraceae bacterium]
MMDAIQVLMIDDEELFVERMTKVLSRRGMEVRSASDGRKGVELFAGGDCDVVVLDIRMPGMNGLEIFKAIRELDPLTPVIFLSGHMDSRQVAQALKGGNTEILLKPCLVETLASSIEDACERRRCFLDLSGRE